MKKNKLKGLLLSAFGGVALAGCATTSQSVTAGLDPATGLVTQTTEVKRGDRVVSTQQEIVDFNEEWAADRRAQEAQQRAHAVEMERLRVSADLLAQGFSRAETPAERTAVLNQITARLESTNPDLKKTMETALEERNITREILAEALVVTDCTPVRSANGTTAFRCQR